MRKTFSIVLTIIVLLNVFGPVMATHRCGGILVEMYLGNSVPDLGCGMESEEDFCATHQNDDGLNKASCCHDDLARSQVEVLQSVDLTSLDLPSLNLIVNPFLADPAILSFDCPSRFFADLSPPPVLLEDIHIVFQVFRI